MLGSPRLRVLCLCPACDGVWGGKRKKKVGDGGSSDGRGGGGKVVGLTLSADVPVEARAHEQPVCEYVQRRAGQMRPSGVTLYYRARRVEEKKFIEYRSTYDRGPPSHASWQDRLSRLHAPQ